MNRKMCSIAKRAISLLTGMILLLSLAGCTAKDRSAIQKDAIEPFEKACREGDVKEILRCFDPSISDRILTAIGVADILGITDYLDRFADLIDNFTKIDVPIHDFLSSISIKTREYSFNEEKDKCVVTADVSYQKGENTKTVVATFRCVKIDGKWYLRRIGF